jgi:hypothetical protein
MRVCDMADVVHGGRRMPRAEQNRQATKRVHMRALHWPVAAPVATERHPFNADKRDSALDLKAITEGETE